MDAIVRFLQHVVRNHAWWVIGFHGVAVVACAVVALDLTVDPTVDGLMVASDPELVASNQLKEEFSNDEIIVAAFDLGHPFTVDDLRRLSKVTEELRSIDGVDEVMSLSDVDDVRSDGAGGIDVSPLLSADALAELDSAGLSVLTERVRSHRIYPRVLVSKDMKVLSTVIVLEAPNAGKLNIRAASEKIESTLASATKGWVPYYVTGYPLLERESDVQVKHDLFTLGPVSFVFILLVFGMVARRAFAVLLLFTLSVWTSAMAVAYFALTQTPINMVTSAIPPILLTTSGTYGIFVLGLMQTLHDRPDPAMVLIAHATRPSFLAMTANVGGFLSLCFIEIDAIQELGIGMAVGIFAAFFATILLIPALIQVTGFRAAPVRYRWITSGSTVGVRWARRPKRVVLGVVVLVLLCVPGLAQVYIETNPVDYFRDDSPTVRAHDFVRDHLGGAGLVNIVIRTDKEGDALRPEVMALASLLAEGVARSPVVDHIVSLLDYNLLLDAALRPGERPRAVLPTKEAQSQYLFLYEMNGDVGDLRHYLNSDRSAVTLRVRAHNFGSSAILELADHIRAVAAEHPVAGARVEVLGSVYMLAKSAQSISFGMVPGLISTVVIILITFWIALKSLKLALIALPPNLLPYAICLAAMGYAGIPISLGTSIVGFLAIGLATDDTAHVLAEFAQGRSLMSVYREVGLPVILTSVALGSGFLVLAFSSFEVIAVLGIATGVTLAVAVLGDLILLPSILRIAGYALDDEELARRAPAAKIRHTNEATVAPPLPETT